VSCDQHHCVTCSDEALPMTVLRIDAERGLALCTDIEGAEQTVETALVEPVHAGDRVMVHAGVALVAVPA
jgi:hydrogenase expression/formation protein HypC